MNFLGRALLWLIGAANGVALTILTGWQVIVIGVNFSMATSVALCGLGFVAFFALLFVHELGHQSVSLAVGLPFHTFTVGPLQLIRDGERIRVTLNTAWYQPAAYVLFALPTGPAWRLRFAAAVAGGPLANLLVAGGCLIGASWVNPGPPLDMPVAARQGFRTAALTYPGNPLTAGLNIVGLVSLGFGIGNLLPSSVAGVRSDGGQLLDLCRGAIPRVWGEPTAALVPTLEPTEPTRAPPLG